MSSCSVFCREEECVQIGATWNWQASRSTLQVLTQSQGAAVRRVLRNRTTFADFPGGTFAVEWWSWASLV